MSVMHLNQRELSERWNLGKGTLESWRSRGIGPVFLKLNGRVLYRVSDVEEYETTSLRKSTSERCVEKTTGGVA